MASQQFSSVDEYIASFAQDVRDVLGALRCTVRGSAPDAVESISYHMPTYSLGDRPLVFFAGWKTHVALYAIPRFDDDALEAEVAGYRAAKDTVKFPLRKPVPLDLVGRLVAELVRVKG
ncbi:iron chaperone [Herbiconiux sp. A18JL235]|uniref:Iron chaperone n=1 Tax=Herbiconiux sp. A18JL235 TaxID=3152363 RepID=A0AB39BC84_9MICO